MNRIILIGNGFDLAHGLKTSYKDFMDWYWDEWIKKLQKSNSTNESDILCKFVSKDAATSWDRIMSHINKQYWKEILKELKQYPRSIAITQCSFLQNICQFIENNNWVDVEHEYYQLLKNVTFESEENDFTCTELNHQLSFLKNKLIDYLNLENKSSQIKKELNERIYSPIRFQDISVHGRDAFKVHIEKWLTCQDTDEWNLRLSQYNVDYSDRIACANELVRAKSDFKSKEFPELKDEHFPPEIRLPNNILLLNFNYTNTAKLYLKEKSGFELNHIHGSLKNPNGIIFGYGDEMDDEYPAIKKRNDNELLKNMKTIRYSETDNYRKMLAFIESAPYQIFIMGHSCGNSDRTLLNTLFEHDNCVSIKPFYHKKEDGTDNYIELVQNISRNFTDMKKMRDRVVNKTYCEPLVGEK